jgi:predicted ATPase
MEESEYLAAGPALGGSARLVVVSGCSGGGKSALLAELARRGHATRPEPGRQVVREQLLIEGDGLPWRDVGTFVELCVSRAAHFYNTVLPGDGPVFFDRSIVDAVAAFARWRRPVPRHLTNAVARYRYAPVVFMAPPWEALFRGDAERRHSFAEAVAEYDDLMRRYPAWGYAVRVIPKAGVAARADFVERALGLTKE